MSFLSKSLTDVKLPRLITSRWVREKSIFDLVEPGRVGRRVMCLPRIRNEFGPVVADGVAADLDLAALGLAGDHLAQEADELHVV